MRLFWILLFVVLAKGAAAAICNSTLPCDCPACSACGTTPITFKPKCIKCINGWGMNWVKGFCVKCTAGAGCIRCNGRFPGVCTACQKGWTLVNGKCHRCWPGSNGCAKCTKDANGTERCSQCLSNRFINGVWTIYYFGADDRCHICSIHDPSCRLCSGDGKRCALCDDPVNNPLCLLG